MGGVKNNITFDTNYTTPKNITYDELIFKIPHATVSLAFGFVNYLILLDLFLGRSIHDDAAYVALCDTIFRHRFMIFWVGSACVLVGSDK